MSLKKTTSWIKRSFLVDTQSDLKELYEQMSNIELAILLDNQGLRPEATELARHTLADRLTLSPDFSQSDAVDVELNRLYDHSKLCQIFKDFQGSALSLSFNLH